MAHLAGKFNSKRGDTSTDSGTYNLLLALERPEVAVGGSIGAFSGLLERWHTILGVQLVRKQLPMRSAGENGRALCC